MEDSSVIENLLKSTGWSYEDLLGKLQRYKSGSSSDDAGKDELSMIRTNKIGNGVSLLASHCGSDSHLTNGNDQINVETEAQGTVTEDDHSCQNVGDHNYSNSKMMELDDQETIFTESADVPKSEDSLRDIIRMQLSSLRNMKKSNAYMSDLTKKKTILFHNRKKKRKSCDVQVLTPLNVDDSENCEGTGEDLGGQKNAVSISENALISLADDSQFVIVNVTGGVDRLSVEKEDTHLKENEKRRFPFMSTDDKVESGSVHPESSKHDVSPKKGLQENKERLFPIMSTDDKDESGIVRLERSKHDVSPKKGLKNILTTYRRKMSLNYFDANRYSHTNTPRPISVRRNISESFDRDPGIDKSVKNSEKSPFVSDSLEDFLNESSQLKISYAIPKLGAEEGLTKCAKKSPYDNVTNRHTKIETVTPPDTSHKEQTKLPKAKTLAEMRRNIEKMKSAIGTLKKANTQALEKHENPSENSLNIASHRNSFVICNRKKLWVSSKFKNKCLALIDTSQKKIKGTHEKTATPKQGLVVPRKPSLLASLQDNKVTKVKYKPGPLCKKPQLQCVDSRNNWITELKKLPQIYLEVAPEVSKPIDPRIAHLVPVFNDCTITEERAKFALSALKSKNNVDPVSFKFRVSYHNNQDKVAVRKRFEPSIMVKSSVVHEDINSQATISNILSDIIGYIEVKEIEDVLIKEDETLAEHEESSEGAVKMKPRKRTRKLDLELRRLNCKVINVATDAVEEAQCRKPFCKLGCVCKSLMCHSVFSNHCQMVDCMFGCTCPQAAEAKTTLSDDTVNHLEDRAKKYLAKEEREFTQTLIHTDNDTILVGTGGRNRTKRTSKVPKKYNDFIGDIDEMLQVLPSSALAPVEPPPSATDNARSTKVKECSVRLDQLNLDGIIPFCFCHKIYNCHCRGQVVDFTTTPSKNVIPKIRIVKSKEDQHKSWYNSCARIRSVFSEYKERNKHPQYNQRLRCNSVRSEESRKESEDITVISPPLAKPAARKATKRKQLFSVREDAPLKPKPIKNGSFERTKENSVISKKEFAIQRRRKKNKCDIPNTKRNCPAKVDHSIFEGEIKVSIKDNKDMLKVIGQENASLEYLRILPWSKVIESFHSGKMNIWSRKKYSSTLLCNAAGYFPPKYFTDIRKVEQKSDIIKWILTDCLPPDRPRELMHLILTPKKSHFLVSGFCLKHQAKELPIPNNNIDKELHTSTETPVAGSAESVGSVAEKLYCHEVLQPVDKELLQSRNNFVADAKADSLPEVSILNREPVSSSLKFIRIPPNCRIQGMQVVSRPELMPKIDSGPENVPAETPIPIGFIRCRTDLQAGKTSVEEPPSLGPKVLDSPSSVGSPPWKPKIIVRTVNMTGRQGPTRTELWYQNGAKRLRSILNVPSKNRIGQVILTSPTLQPAVTVLPSPEVTTESQSAQTVPNTETASTEKPPNPTEDIQLRVESTVPTSSPNSAKILVGTEGCPDALPNSKLVKRTRKMNTKVPCLSPSLRRFVKIAPKIVGPVQCGLSERKALNLPPDRAQNVSNQEMESKIIGLRSKHLSKEKQRISEKSVEVSICVQPVSATEVSEESVEISIFVQPVSDSEVKERDEHEINCDRLPIRSAPVAQQLKIVSTKLPSLEDHRDVDFSNKDYDKSMPIDAIVAELTRTVKDDAETNKNNTKEAEVTYSPEPLVLDTDPDEENVSMSIDCVSPIVVSEGDLLEPMKMSEMGSTQEDIASSGKRMELSVESMQVSETGSTEKDITAILKRMATSVEPMKVPETENTVKRVEPSVESMKVPVTESIAENSASTVKRVEPSIEPMKVSEAGSTEEDSASTSKRMEPSIKPMKVSEAGSTEEDSASASKRIEPSIEPMKVSEAGSTEEDSASASIRMEPSIEPMKVSEAGSTEEDSASASKSMEPSVLPTILDEQEAPVPSEPHLKTAKTSHEKCSGPKKSSGSPNKVKRGNSVSKLIQRPVKRPQRSRKLAEPAVSGKPAKRRGVERKPKKVTKNAPLKHTSKTIPPAVDDQEENKKEETEPSSRVLTCTHKDMYNRNKILILTNIGNTKRKLYLNKVPNEEISVALPKGSKNLKWWMVYLNSDFSFLSFKVANYSIKYTDLADVVKLSRNIRSTITLTNKEFSGHYKHPEFGIACTPCFEDRLFIGPYLPAEKHHVATLRYLRGKLIDTQIFNNMVGREAGGKAPTWVYEMPIRPPTANDDVIIDITQDDDDVITLDVDDSGDENDAGNSLLCPPFVEELTVVEVKMKKVNRYVMTTIPHLGYLEAYQNDSPALEVFWPSGMKSYRFPDVIFAKSSLIRYLSDIFRPVPQDFEVNVIVMTDLDLKSNKPIDPKYFSQRHPRICGDFGVYDKDTVPDELLKKYDAPSFELLLKQTSREEENEDEMIRLFGLFLMSNDEFRKHSDPKSVLQWAVSEVYIQKKLSDNYEAEKSDLKNMKRKNVDLMRRLRKEEAIQWASKAAVEEVIEIEDSDEEDNQREKVREKEAPLNRKREGRSLLKPQFQRRNSVLNTKKK